MVRAVLLLLFACVSTAALAAPQGPVVYRIRVEGVISPASSMYISRAIREAHAAGAAALVVELDTPGGLLKSTDDITKAILSSPVPVIVYVAPPGARAASAGVFVVYAAHVAAMAPTTNLGAATPVAVGGEQETESQRTMIRKATEDAVAKIRTLARRRGRNAEWGERAVRQAAALPSEEAVRMDVVDLLASDVHDLLARVDGRTVEVLGASRVLRTRGARVVDVGMDLRERFLDLLAEPNVGLILMTVAIYGILFELNNPGAVLPGVVGAIALILALASFAILQVNYAGLALIALGIALLMAELFVPGFGILGVGGIVAFILGGILLTSNQEPYLRASVPLVVGLGLATGAFFLFALGAGVRAQRRQPASGPQALVGRVGLAKTDVDGQGLVLVAGEDWSAEAEEPVRAGERVRVVGVEGLRLRVRKEG
ncbi:MAG: nodulation protein NfeD [Armatimonadota bacterium]|nr:nodulation protein NfeD [Armatimonadota bacterium]MDW8155279.1 nodulation protein NfeD [Armatimonadota bacterium]